MKPTRRAIRVAAICVSAAIVACFGYFIWPTPYRTAPVPQMLQPHAENPWCCFAARVQRVTSEVQVLGVDGWQPLSLTRGDSVSRETARLLLNLK